MKEQRVEYWGNVGITKPKFMVPHDCTSIILINYKCFRMENDVFCLLRLKKVYSVQRVNFMTQSGVECVSSFYYYTLLSVFFLFAYSTEQSEFSGFSAVN